MSHRCPKQILELFNQLLCQWLSSEAYCCGLHLKLSNRPFDSILIRTKNSSSREPKLFKELNKKSSEPPANTGHQTESLYLISENANLLIYDLENEKRKVKVLKIPRKINTVDTSIIQIPNGELFCVNQSDKSPFYAFIIDENYRVRELLYEASCRYKLATYVNRNIYCFGSATSWVDAPLSGRFNLDENRWIKLAPMPKAYYSWHCVMFNGNIVISGLRNRNLLHYSIDINSFSIIPYKFEKKSKKILLSAERLYLIETFGFMYESTIGDEYSWQQIAKSIFNDDYQVYYLRNKEGIFIPITFIRRICNIYE